jgi:SAM-dependent methyltransferase
MITAEGMKPFGLAVRDFYAGDVTSEVVFRRDDGVVNTLAVSALFRGPVDFQVDKVLLDLCTGKILDVGAGVGIHSLFLQGIGFTVYALDVSPEACQVMKHRGVKNVICSSAVELQSGVFDTILLLGRSICMVETLSGLEEFLTYTRRLVNPAGQILLNSLDVACTKDPRDLTYHEINRQAGRYIGEIRVRLEYKDLIGPRIGMLHVDSVELARYAAKTGWSFEVLLKEKDGHYAARLKKKD